MKNFVKNLSLVFTSVISFGIIFLFCTNKYEKPNINAQIIFPDSSITLVSKNALDRQQSILISTLLQRESNESNYITSQDSIISQARNIFMILLGGLLGLIITRWEEKDKNYFLITLMFFLTLIFLLLDVHLGDLKVRSFESRVNTAKTVNSLVNQYPNELLTYKLDYKNQVSVTDSLSDTSKLRKLYKIGDPDGDQIIFFHFPLFFLYVWCLIIFVQLQKNKTR